MHPLRRLRGAALACASIPMLAATATAQSGAWSDEFDRPGLLGRVFAVAEVGGQTVAGGLPLEADGQEFGNLARFDGEHWVALGTGIHGSIVRDFAHYQGEFVAAGEFDLAGGTAVKSIARWNGTQWQALGGGIGLSYAVLGTVFSLAVYQDELYAAGRFDRADNVVVANVARWDGTQWRTVGSGFNGDVYALQTGADGKLYAGGSFATAGGAAATNIAAWDGTSWSAVGTGLGVAFNSSVRALEWHAGKLFAGGYFDLAGGALHEKLASWDGNTWQAAGSFPDSSVSVQISALQSSGADLYVGGGIVSVNGLPIDRIARLTGTQWSSIGGLRGYPNDTQVLTLGLHGSELVVGGYYTHVSATFTPGSEIVTNNIARFDGARWHQTGRGLGFDADVFGGTLWNGGVVALGRFVEAGRSRARCAAYFDGSDWTQLGALDGPGNGWDACVFQNELVIAGEFATVNGVSMPGVAAFDGTAWHGFGSSGFGGGYGALTVAVYQNQLYAGTIGGVKRWNGTAWETFAPQIFGAVLDLHVHNDVLYIAGEFSLMGGHLASWNGATQQLVGGGMNAGVDALASFGGDLVAGGTFTVAGGVPAHRVARWNGSAWSALPGLTGQQVASLAVFRGELYAGGNPVLAPPNLHYIARWTGAQWLPLGGGVNGQVHVLIPDEAAAKLYVGGWFQDAEARPSFAFAAWELGLPAGVASFCHGDGALTDHTTPCPCGNDGAPGRGCGHSFDANGARLAASGTPAGDDLTLLSSFEPASAFTMFLQHDAAADTVFHDGTLCASGALVRLRGRAAAAGAASFPNSNFSNDVTLTLSQRGGVFPGQGVRRYYSAWFRNASSTFCPPATANVTNGLRVDW